MAIKKAKENPKGTDALRVLQAVEREILGDRVRPRSVPDGMLDDWQRDTQFRLWVWLREINRLAKRQPDTDIALACSALLQGFLKIMDLHVPVGVFKDDLRSPGRGRKPTIDTKLLRREHDHGKSYGQIAKRHFPDLPPTIGYMKVRDQLKSASERVSRSPPLDGRVFDQICRMLGVMTPDEQVEYDIRRSEEYNENPETSVEEEHGFTEEPAAPRNKPG